MCGIFALLNVDGTDICNRMMAMKASSLQRHRGPDNTGVKVFSRGILVHERLGVVSPEDGAQPMSSPCGKVTIIANAEIYNYGSILDECDAYVPRTANDCEAILASYLAHGVHFVDKLDGIFGILIIDERPTNPRFVVTRDHIGINPLYLGWGCENGSFCISSEMKCIEKSCDTLRQFPPGEIMVGTLKRNGDLFGMNRWQWYNPRWKDYCYDSAEALFPPMLLGHHIRNALVSAVRKQATADVPFGCLLSGGLDSSLVASIAARSCNEPLHTFSVGLKTSPDLVRAKEVANFIRSVHHELTFTVDEGWDVLRNVIWHIESYDVTTVRASVPMYLLARHIKSMGFKMVLSGEGADELFGGYLYFHKAPNVSEFFEETVRKVHQLHKYDCLRCNKCMMAWGVEPRVPFLDKDLVNLTMNGDAASKICKNKDGEPRIEKHVLREAFDDTERPYLPQDVLWRQKEQFSDGVGYEWIESLKRLASDCVSDNLMTSRKEHFPHNSPETKEAYLYRSLFEEMFHSRAAIETVPGGPSIACSTAAAVQWDPSFAKHNDQSGLSVKDVHKKTCFQ